MNFTPAGCNGNDPVLIFVPGWVSLISGWVDVLRVITPHVRVIYLETREKISAVLPTGPLPEFTLERMSQDLLELIEALLPDQRPFYLAGSSLGSSLILDYLKKDHRPIPEKAILISPVTEFNFPFWARCIIRYMPPSAYALVKHGIIFYLTRFKVDKNREPEQAEKYRGTLSAAEPVRLKANAQAMCGYTVWDGLVSVRTRVVVVGAASDRLHGVEPLERMVSLMPLARLEVMTSNRESHSEKAGHLLLEEMNIGSSSH
jgi:pimeloyl-ACP methyl ester carboxylesterase